MPGAAKRVFRAATRLAGDYEIGSRTYLIIPRGGSWAGTLRCAGLRSIWRRVMIPGMSVPALTPLHFILCPHTAAIAMDNLP